MAPGAVAGTGIVALLLSCSGPLTVTDCNLMLGRLSPQYFPRVFGPSADDPLDAAAIERLRATGVI